MADVYDRARVGEQELEERFNVEPECYGDTESDSDETEMLKLHAKFTVFEKIDQINTESDIIT